MKCKLWGVRGSLPRPETPANSFHRFKAVVTEALSRNLKVADLDGFLRQCGPVGVGGFGGHTSCFEVRQGETQLVIDCGSGLKELGMELLRGPCGKGQGVVHIYFTHFHWDHLIGLPFFIPIFIPGNQINFYAVHSDLERVVRTLFQKPFFPLDFNNLESDIRFHSLEPRKEYHLGGLSLTPYLLDHPDPCWGLKISDGTHSLAHCVDTEARRITEVELGPDAPLYKGIDLMIFDAQYSLLEVIDKIHWGHAVASLGLDIALREKIKQVLFVHHDPYATDEKIQEGIVQTRSYYNSLIEDHARKGNPPFEVQWQFAQEGDEIILGVG